jgi:hypothetical protein
VEWAEAGGTSTGDGARRVEATTTLFFAKASSLRRDDAFTTACVASPSGATSATMTPRAPESGGRPASRVAFVIAERAHYPPTQRGYVRTNTRLVLLYASLYGDDDDDDDGASRAKTTTMNHAAPRISCRRKQSIVNRRCCDP